MTTRSNCDGSGSRANKRPVLFAPGAATRPRLAWQGASADLVLFATLDVSTPFGEHPVHLIVPRHGLCMRLAAADAPAGEVSAVVEREFGITDALCRKVLAEALAKGGTARVQR